MRRRPEPPAPAKPIGRPPLRRTVFVRKTETDRAPQELWDIICRGSHVVLIVDAPDEGFSIYGDRVVSWNDPDVTIDGLSYVWPEQSADIQQLFEP